MAWLDEQRPNALRSATHAILEKHLRLLVLLLTSEPPLPVQVIELVMEVVLLRQNSIEHQLKMLFVAGDENGDGVLSYEEFKDIVRR